MIGIIQEAMQDPEQLEQRYRDAKHSGEAAAFEAAIREVYAAAPDNVLIAAWFYRFQSAEETPAASKKGVNWRAAVLLSALTGLIFWWVSDITYPHIDGGLPVLLHWWSPIATLSALVFLALTAQRKVTRAVAFGFGLASVALYVVLLAPTQDVTWFEEQYLIQALFHIPLLSWVALGFSVLGWKSSRADRFAFLIKSIEVVITAGLFLGAGMAFGGITIGLFAALNINLDEIWYRLISAGGVGLLPVLAVATVYDPTRSPAEQDFDQGLSRFIATLMRLLLPLTLGVLAIYVVVIPFNFMEPFESRDLLIVYNVMLFAIIGLLLGATPIRSADLSPVLKTWLRRGVIAVSVLVELVSVYALTAVVYRTIDGGWTLNRLTIIGWNSINIVILFALLYCLFKYKKEDWVETQQRVFSMATNAYVVWALFLMLAAPLLF